MGSGAWMMALATVLALGSLLWLISALARSISNERTGERSVWREFGRGLAELQSTSPDNDGLISDCGGTS